MKTPSPCPDCGPEQVLHAAERISVFLGWLMHPVTSPLDRLWRTIGPFAGPILFDRFGLLAVKALTRLNAGKMRYALDPRDALMTKCLWEEAERRGIRMGTFRLGDGAKSVIVAEHEGTTICFEGLPRPSVSYSEAIGWMDNKTVLKKKFLAMGFPVAKGGARATLSGAMKLFKTLEAPVITKPHIGSASRHTTIHMRNEEELARGFKSAAELSPWVLIEEELSGRVFRITIVDGKVVGVIRRDQPHVVGDGTHSVRELVEAENQHPLRQGPLFHPIRMGEEAEAELAYQGLTFESVPEKERRVTLHQKINWSVGGSTTDVSDEVHEENIRLFERIGAFINDPLVGIDFVIGDMARPWTDQKRCGVIECNSLPFIDNHHYPFSGTPRNVAGKLWDLVFPEKSLKNSLGS